MVARDIDVSISFDHYLFHSAREKKTADSRSKPVFRIRFLESYCRAFSWDKEFRKCAVHGFL